MSGGRLVVTDRAGRDIKRYSLPSGLVTVGSDPTCDIRVMLPAVEAHHATVVVRSNQTIIRNVANGETLVNGEPVSVAALQHGDLITLGDRSLRWEYDEPKPRNGPNLPALLVKKGKKPVRGRKRHSEVTSKKIDPSVQLMLEMKHRASMPGSAKQVAIVQPQRRDTNDSNDKPRVVVKPHRPYSTGKRVSRASNAQKDQDILITENEERSKRKSTPKSTPTKAMDLQTKASLWIESRKSTPRKSTSKQPTPRSTKGTNSPAPKGTKNTPLRTVVLRKTLTPLNSKPVYTPRKTQSVTKIQAPLKIDHTKQAALMLMARHTNKSISSPDPRTQEQIPKKSPGRISKSPKSAIKSPKSVVSPKSVTSPSGSTSSQSSPLYKSTRMSAVLSPAKSNVKKSPRNSRVNVDESISLFDTTNLDRTSRSRRNNSSHIFVPPTPTPKKSAMKNPLKPKPTRKGESIKFDLSNLDLEDDQTKSILLSPRAQSRSSKILQQTLGSTFVTDVSSAVTLTPQSTRKRQSRSSGIVEKALKSPRSKKSYSIVDLVSLDDSQTDYDSAESVTGTSFGTPNSTRKSKASLQSSTPYIRSNRSTIASDSFTFTRGPQRATTRDTTIESVKSINSTKSRNPSLVASKIRNSTLSSTKSKNISVNSSRSNQSSLFDAESLLNSTRSSRNSSRNSTQNLTKSLQVSKRSSSSQNDSDIIILSKTNDSINNTRKSKRSSGSLPQPSPKKAKISISSNNISPSSSTRSRKSNSVSSPDGLHTPENQSSPPSVAGTPVLNMQSLLESSYTENLNNRRSRVSANLKRKTIGNLPQKSAEKPNQKRSKSLNLSDAKKIISRLSKNSTISPDRTDLNASNDETVTPKSTIKLRQEAVKEKHSTAKKPVSKRSIIDNLNDSDIVKQLFASPVKRKLSQSMTEFDKKENRRNSRKTLPSSMEQDSLNKTVTYPTEIFVSPLSTPNQSPNLSSIKKMYAKNSPKPAPKSPRGRKSVKNDLTNVAGVKDTFARAPRNRLSDLRGVKEIFTGSPANDLRRVSGVKSLFQSEKEKRQPRNSLSNVQGVKTLFQRSPKNDLRNVSGVKKMIAKSPRNDLRDVRGVKKLFTREKSKGLSDLSGVEELFNASFESDRIEASHSESLFDQLVGRPTLKATYAKSFNKSQEKTQNKRSTKSLNNSITTNNVETWIEKELSSRFKNVSNAKTPKQLRELEKLKTNTVDGNTPVQRTRVRNSTMDKSKDPRKSASETYSARKLPIKKRSLNNKSENSLNSSKTLPIKKRPLLHSTPVKGKNISASVTELGRVSPIIDMEIDIPLEQPAPFPKATPKKQTPKITRRTIGRKSTSKLATPTPKSTKKVPNKSLSQSLRKTKSPIVEVTPKTSPKKVVAKKSLVKSVQKGNISKSSPIKQATTKQSTITPKAVQKAITPKSTQKSATLKTPKKVATPKSARKTPKSAQKTTTPKSAQKAATPNKVVAKKSLVNSVQKGRISKNSPLKQGTPKAAMTKSSATPKSTPKTPKSTPKTPNSAQKTPKSVKAVTPKSAQKAVTPKAVTPKKVATPKLVKKTPKSAERTITPRSAPKNVTPKTDTPKKIATPKSAKKTPKSAQKAITPKSVQKSATPKTSPKKVVAKKSLVNSVQKGRISKSSPLKQVTPKRLSATPKSVTKTPKSAQKAMTPKSATNTLTPKATSRQITPKPVTPKSVTPKSVRQPPTPSSTPKSKSKSPVKQVIPKPVAKPVTPKAVTPKSDTPKPRRAATKRPSAKPAVKETSPKKRRIASKPVTPKPSTPKQTKKVAANKQEVALSPKPKRGTRARNTEPATNTKKRRSSLVITKKAPVLSPQATETRRGRRGAAPKVAEVKTKAVPKKASKAKTDPKPQPKKADPKPASPKKATRTRKTVASPSPKKSKSVRQNAKKTVTPQKPATPKKSTRAPVKKLATPSPKKTKTRAKSASPIKPQSPKKTRGKKEVKVATPKPRARAKPNSVAISKPSPVIKPASPVKRRGRAAPVSPAPKTNNRKRKIEEISEETVKVTKGKDTKGSSKNTAKTQEKKTKTAKETATKQNARKRISDPAPTKDQPPVKRSRKAAEPVSPIKSTRNARKTAVKKPATPVAAKSTRSRRR